MPLQSHLIDHQPSLGQCTNFNLHVRAIGLFCWIFFFKNRNQLFPHYADMKNSRKAETCGGFLSPCNIKLLSGRNSLDNSREPQASLLFQQHMHIQQEERKSPLKTRTENRQQLVCQNRPVAFSMLGEMILCLGNSPDGCFGVKDEASPPPQKEDLEKW